MHVLHTGYRGLAQALPHDVSGLHHVAQRGDDLGPVAGLEAAVGRDNQAVRAVLQVCCSRSRAQGQEEDATMVPPGGATALQREWLYSHVLRQGQCICQRAPEWHTRWDNLTRSALTLNCSQVAA